MTRDNQILRKLHRDLACHATGRLVCVASSTESWDFLWGVPLPLYDDGLTPVKPSAHPRTKRTDVVRGFEPDCSGSSPVAWSGAPRGLCEALPRVLTGICRRTDRLIISSPSDKYGQASRSLCWQISRDIYHFQTEGCLLGESASITDKVVFAWPQALLHRMMPANEL